MKLIRWVVIDCTTNKIVARYTKESYCDAMIEELTKQSNLFTGKTVEKSWEEYINGKLNDFGYDKEVVNKPDSNISEKYFTSPRPAFLNNKVAKEFAEAERKKRDKRPPPKQRKQFVVLSEKTKKVLGRFPDEYERDMFKQGIENGHSILKFGKMVSASEVWEGKKLVETIVSE